MTHADDSGLFCDLGSEHLRGYITQRVACDLIDPLAHLLQGNLSVENQKLFG